MKIIGTPVPESKMLKLLKRKVFTYDSSEADERYFRQGITEFFRDLDCGPFLHSPVIWNNGPESFKDMLYRLSHDRNAGGYTTKYMHFSEKSQRVYLDNTFFEWAILVARMIYAELKQMKG